ncbi:MAG: HigA family addiction module antitoxin, partial [Sphaerochaetaceae bacterium]|nr:HigA family addiction module antitoxin [Sphaerochaetaceae bacterium]
MTNIKTLKPARVKGPGNIILRYLNSLGWNQVDLAEITGVSVKTISQIINHKQAISVEMAKVLAKAFNNNPEFWLNLDNQYRLQSVNSESKENSAAIKAKIRRYMPVLEIQKNNWVQTSDNTAKGYEATFREIWGTDYNDTSVYEKSPQYAARNNKENPDYTCFYSMTWLKIAHNRAEKLSVPLYDRTKLEQIQTDFSKLTLYPDGINVLQKELKDAGVKFLYQKPLKKTYLDGACFFDGDNPVIVYTGRYDRIDHFWFTMAHEISHILLHLKKSD